MANLAIKGHSTRGEEVIEILEMLGGKNISKFDGSYTHDFYFLNNNIIYDSYGSGKLLDINCYTLEEFLEKFPYKVGDKVTIKERDKSVTITDMSWRNGREIIYETIHNGDCYECFSAEQLQPYKEETFGECIEKTIQECLFGKEETMKERKLSDLRLDADQDDKLATEATIDGSKITPPENYLIGKITKVDNGMLVEFVKKQPQYPKTYEECCEVLGYRLVGETVIGYDAKLITSFQRLKVCRNAYWKIAGEQMGLGKPWKPDFKDDSDKYFICYVKDEVWKSNIRDCNRLLVFPTAEMRDAFYENFKDLIMKCKELL